MRFLKKILRKIIGGVKFKRTKPSEQNEPKTQEEGSEWKPSPMRQRIPIMKYIFLVAICSVVILTGLLAGLLIVQAKGTKKVFTAPVPLQTEEKKSTPALYSALDPVSGDWTISTSQLMERMNLVLDKTGARSSIIKSFVTISPSEFRHYFSSALQLFGESNDNGHVVRVALLFDPSSESAEYQNALAIIRSIIASTDPSLSRKDILEIIKSLGLSENLNAPQYRQSEYRSEKFIFKLWSVAGRAFVFTASAI